VQTIQVNEDVFTSCSIVEVDYELENGEEVVGYFFLEAIGIASELNVVSPERPIPVIKEEDLIKVVFYGNFLFFYFN
jgi:hypothetical protein